MSTQSSAYPDFPDTSELTEDEAIKALKRSMSSWIMTNAEELEPTQVIAPATEEVFVPYRFTYPDILRTWLELHADAQDGDDADAQILLEKVIETTILDEAESGDLIRDTL